MPVSRAVRTKPEAESGNMPERASLGDLRKGETAGRKFRPLWKEQVVGLILGIATLRNRIWLM
jgi:hypothetical protein